MLPGILDKKLVPKPVTRVSPSRYLAMAQCMLNGAWAAGHQIPLLPPWPGARLGTAFHLLLQEAASGRMESGSEAGVEERWDKLVEKIEGEMASSWLERHLIPLESSVRDFHVRRLQAIRMAKEISGKVQEARGEPVEGPLLSGTELWVQSKDGQVGGYIDRVVWLEEGPVIQDFKSGEVENPRGQPGEIKQNYVLQLQLYAALYAEHTGVWPARLELVSLQGSSVEVPFDRDGCQELLAGAKEILLTVNGTIRNHWPDPERIQERLAIPELANCRFCPYRPACIPYRRYRSQLGPSAGDDDWPADVWGELKMVNQLQNSTLVLVLETGQPKETSVFIRGINRNSSRHPALGHLKPGSRAGVFNLRSSGTGQNPAEGLLTTIYLLGKSGQAGV